MSSLFSSSNHSPENLQTSLPGEEEEKVPPKQYNVSKSDVPNTPKLRIVEPRKLLSILNPNLLPHEVSTMKEEEDDDKDWLEINFKLDGKEDTLIHLQGKQQLRLGLAVIVSALVVFAIGISLGFKSYYHGKSQMLIWDMTQQVNNWKLLVDNKDSDKKFRKKQQQEILLWKQESKARQAQIVGIRSQCENDWKEVHEYQKGKYEACLTQLQQQNGSINEENSQQGSSSMNSIVQDLMQLEKEKYNQEIIGFQDQLESLRQERDDLQRQLHDIESTLKQAMEERTKAVESQQEVVNMKSVIQRHSRQRLIKWLGQGPYRVQMKLLFPGDDDFQNITIELDGENLPHTVYTFLMQVEQGLYDDAGFFFHHNGVHVTFASLLVEGKPEILNLWESSGFGQRIFQEYSHHSPHEAYTIGFRGLGSSMYFNTRDNTDLHRGIDPCLGKVINGQDVIDRMHSSTGVLHDDDWKELQPGPVAIAKIVIIN